MTTSCARVEDAADPLTDEQLVRLSDDALWELHERSPDSIQTYPHGIYSDITEFDEDWYGVRRRKANDLIKRYIRVKPQILSRVDQLQAERFGDGPVLGIQLRGSDKGSAKSSAKLMRIISPEQYYPYIDQYLAENAGCRIFVATDQVQFLDQLRDRYGEKIISLPAARSSGALATFNVHDRQTSNYNKGEEVLVDCLLLAPLRLPVEMHIRRRRVCDLLQCRP